MTPAESFSQTDQADTSPDPRASLLMGGGEMGERIRTFEWENTPLGRLQQWPQSLLTLVSTSIRSRFPIVIWWDRLHYTTFYNDAYIPALGKTKHPGWLGRSGKECWSDIWSIIGPMLESVFETGQPTWSEDLLLIMDRNLPREETYFTFSYSAVLGETGSVDGIFCACTETTERVIGERRLQTLRDLASATSQGRSAGEACEIAARLLAHNTTDIPFALIYLLDRDRMAANLVAHSGVSSPDLNETSPVPLSSSQGTRPWPLGEVAREGASVVVSPLPSEWETLPAGPWPEPADRALVLPLLTPGLNQVTGLLVVGVNPRRELDVPYQDFFQMVAGHVATAVANARTYEEERKRAEALAELDQAKTLFFSNISHEFRTPLTLMLGPIEDLLASGSGLSPAEREALDLLRRNAFRLLRLVNTLLDFSRLEAGRMEAVYEPVDLVALTRDLASTFRSAIEKAGMTLLIECPRALPTVYVDQQMWEKILLNLLSNAFKYTFSGTIMVRIESKEHVVEVSVRDTGVGIPASELPHMFERFHRVKGTAGRTYEGTGIGLSLVYELVKLHAGSLHVSSTPGRGSTFTVSLPLGSSHLPRERLAARRTLSSTSVGISTYVEEALLLLEGQGAVADLLPDLAPSGPPSPASSSLLAETGEQQPGAQILFVDDNADMRSYISRLLHPRYRVQVAADGFAALKAVRQFPPDLVLADVMMPGMDGFALLHALRSDQQTRHIPIILLSARAGEEARIEGMTKGADDYLIKPFSARELLARVGAHVEMARLRKKAQILVLAERQRLYDLFEQAPAVIVVLRGPDHVFELANPLALQVLGVHRPILGKTFREVRVGPEAQDFLTLLDGVYQTGQSYIGTETLVHLDSRDEGMEKERYFNFVLQPSFTASGEIDGVMVYANEISEQVQARQRSEDLSRQKDDFIGVTSHELKTPVTSLKAFAQLLERRFRQGGDARSADLLHKMDIQLTKLRSLVEDLLDVTKIEKGQLRLHCSWFDYNTLMTEVVEEIQHTTPRHRIVLELSESVTLFADRDRIEQVLTNLLTNAIKYSPQSDIVLVRTRWTDKMVVTSVQDFGIGIPTELQPHLFERFYRVEGESHAAYPGLGLGLYIASTCISRHHGEIWVQSEQGQGTTVSFSLPRSTSERAREAEESKDEGNTSEDHPDCR